MEDNFGMDDSGSNSGQDSGNESGDSREPQENTRRRRDEDETRGDEGGAEARGEESARSDESGEGESQRDSGGDGEASKDDAPKRKRTRGGRGRTRKGARGERAERRESDGAPASKKGGKEPHTQMIINYVPGEECRVAIVEDGKLEELHTERFASASHVGNIYVGKVINVEPAIQAAFVDFGMGENGFLHVTDLHPRYFPGESEENTTERIGIKTPRRDRPPIQAALRRGDEIIVQVLKEGVGTKGPTLTSYLSIPGRFLVMMPFMDKVGVSRKVEDEEERRKMREILDQLDLPDGFGFILRTAGMTRTKVELKRDLAYLMRLWKDMDKRLKTGGKPRLLYSESDLLVRALRDVLTGETHEVIVDNDNALTRAARYLKIVAPRTHTKLLHFKDKSPVFHAFGIEKQIALIHAREVPLPSGGRLVIDQTEALVAIDVNSGKSRDSRDSETNAYQTNIEAVDEICRQLRLRDMGGIVINDLIDMRFATHRKDIQKRFEDRLKRDRAKSTVLPISEFGILELTRQRMRPSHESVHFTDCPTCRGRGLLQKPDSVSNDSLRELAALLDISRVHRVEMVVAPRVAGDLLSTKRQLLSRIERTYGKHVDVRVSEAVAADRVTFYAYEADGADIDLTQLPQNRKPGNLIEWIDPDTGESDWSVDLDEEAKAAQEALAEPEPDDSDVHPIELDLSDEEVDRAIAEGKQVAPGDDDGRRGRQRGRGGRGERGGRVERGGRGDRSDRRDRGPRDDRGGGRGDSRRDERGGRDDNRSRDGRHRDERGGREEGGDRGERGRRDDRRGERPRDDRFGDRNDRGDRRDRGGRGDRGDRGGRSDRPQREFVPRDDADEWGEPPSRPLQAAGDEASNQGGAQSGDQAGESARDSARDSARGEWPRGAEDRARRDGADDEAREDAADAADNDSGPDAAQNGAAGEVGPDGEPRRKRRRRRRRGGRGRGGEGQQGDGQLQPGGEDAGGLNDAKGEREESASADDAPRGRRPDDGEWGDSGDDRSKGSGTDRSSNVGVLDEGDADGDEMSVDLESASGASSDDGSRSGDAQNSDTQADDSSDGQRRKRRRRRGGRGRNRNREDGDQRPAGESGPREGRGEGAKREQERPRQAASQDSASRREAPRESAPRESTQREAGRAEPKAAPKADAPQQKPVAAPRTLYGNLRRKLTPAELAKRPKAE